jgi:HEAT repeat protein
MGSHRSPRIALALVVCVVGCTRASDEPSAGGEPLSHWQSEARLVSLLTFWNSDKDERRHQAFRRLVEIGEPAVPALVDLLLEEDVPVSGDALNALCALGSRAAAAVPALARGVASGRDDAAWALGCIGPGAAPAVPALAAAARSGDRQRRDAAARALGRIGGSARDALDQAARADDPGVRASALAGLAPGGPGAAEPRDYLAAAFADPAPEVRVRALDLAHPRTRDEALAMSDLVLRGMNDPSETVSEAARRWYTAVCQSQRDSAALHARVLAEGDPGSRAEAAWRLGTENREHWHFENAELSKEASAALAAALGDRDAKIRIYAARGLASDPGARERAAECCARRSPERTSAHSCAWSGRDRCFRSRAIRATSRTPIAMDFAPPTAGSSSRRSRRSARWEATAPHCARRSSLPRARGRTSTCAGARATCSR